MSRLGLFVLGLAFAITAVLEPEVLLVDEALTVGDLAFQRKCLAHTQSFLGRGGILVLVTHDHALAARAQRQIILRDGRVVSDELNGQGSGGAAE